jgi:hypothetical protein
MPASFQWPQYGYNEVTIPANSISQPAMNTTPGTTYQKNYPVTIDFGSDHNIIAGAAYKITGTGITGMDGVTFYLWPLSNSVVELYTDANLFNAYYFRSVPFFGEAGVAGVAWEGNNTQGLAAQAVDATFTSQNQTLNLGPIINSGITVDEETSPVYRKSIGGLKL